MATLQDVDECNSFFSSFFLPLSAVSPFALFHVGTQKYVSNSVECDAMKRVSNSVHVACISGSFSSLLPRCVYLKQFQLQLVGEEKGRVEEKRREEKGERTAYL